MLDFRLYGSLTGVYDTGLTPVSTDAAGNLVNVGGVYGVEVGFGAFGSKIWRKDQLSLEYRGNYRHYVNNSHFDGTDQFLNLRYGHTITRHISLDIKETAGVSSLANGAFSYLPLTNQDLFAIPTNELFDNKTYFDQTRVDLVWQQSARLSFAFGADGFVVRRHSASLAGLNGYSAHADAAYRLTRRQTVSADYTYTHFDFQRLFGYANTQQASLGYNVGLGRKFDFSISAGASYNEVLGLQTIAVDPAIVAIIGQATVVSNFHRYVVVPYGELRVVRRMAHSSFSISAATGVSPGNGVYLTSRQTGGGANYSYTGIKRWTMGANISYNELSTLGQSLGKYKGVQGGVGATYKIGDPVHLEFRYDYRHYTTQSDIFKKDSSRISIGVAFSPGEKPLPIW